MIANPGFYRLTMEDYVTDPCVTPSLNAGTLTRLLSASPAHAWAQHPRLNPNYKSEEREAFDLGAAAHALLFEGEDRMVVVRADSYRTKAAQEARDAARAEGKHPILEARYEEVFLMRDIALQKIANCADLSGIRLDKDGVAEQTLIWREGDTMFRCRPDWRAHKGDVMVNYKTTAASANPGAWPRTMIGTGADIQATLEARGNSALNDDKPTKVIFLVQEVEAPYACALIGLAPAFREFATSKIECGIDIWRACMKTDSWPSYTDRIAYVEPPAWALSQHEEFMDAGFVLPN